MRDEQEPLDESKFEKKVSPFFYEMKWYCKRLTHNKWESEDLFQDSLIKIYLAMKQQPDRKMTKTFFYRIIKHTWIDRKRKRQLQVEPIDDVMQELHFHEEYESRELLEVLAEYLTIKQFVALLLSNVFAFTAKETATLMNESESNVYTTLHRAKKKLQRYLQVRSYSDMEPQIGPSVRAEKIDSTMFEQFLKGFRTKNPRLIYESYCALSRAGIEVRKGRSIGCTLCFQVIDPDGHVLMICT